MIDRGLESAFRGDIDSTLSIADKATRADVPVEWTLLLRGLANNFGDNSVEAGDLLREALRKNPDNYAVISSLLMTNSPSLLR